MTRPECADEGETVPSTSWTLGAIDVVLGEVDR
jgi:hypothetical protein